MATRKELIDQIKAILDPQPSLSKAFIQKKPDGLWYDVADLVAGNARKGMTKQQCMKTYARYHYFIIPASEVRHAMI